MKTNIKKIKEQAKLNKNNELFFLLLHIPPDNDTYLLGRPEGRALMVWNSFKALKESLERSSGKLLEFRPWPVRVTNKTFNKLSLERIDIFIRHLQDLKEEEKIRTKFIDKLGLYLFPIEQDKIKPYKMINNRN